MTRLDVPGLAAPASISVDTWGMAHIRAESTRDAFFVQGLNAARDRLWQIDLWRKRGLGLLAADFGPGYLMQDRAARLFLYRGDMAPEWEAYGADSEMICTAFAEGINAGIELVRVGHLPLPPEFDALGTEPAHWRPEDVVRIRSHCLTRNAGSELARARVQALADPDVDLLRGPLSPSVPDTEWQANSPVDLADIALDVFQLATAPVTFSPERLAATLEDAPRWATVDGRKTVQPLPPSMEGSNNWAIAPGLTDTGRAIMASDPHRLHAAPSLRYMVHLSAPQMDVIGAGEPSSPGVVIGHNGRAAFSLTIFCADQEDVMVHETQPGNPRAYRHDGDWEAMIRVDETFAVKGAPDQVLPLFFTRYGPVVHDDPARRVAVSIRTVFTDPGTAPYMCSLKSMRSETLGDFRESVKSWGAPSVNLVYADTFGDIGWQAAAYVPRRNGWRGLAPVPGDGRFGWQGYVTAEDLPAIVNPACGFVHSANEMNVPETWDHDALPIGHEWFEDGRADRIAEVIGAAGATGIAGNCALQTDTVSALAARLAARIPDTAPDQARALLAGWTGRSDAGSAPALLFELWFSCHLRPALLARVAPDSDLRKFLIPGSPPTVVRLFEGAYPALAVKAGLADAGARDAFLSETIAAAWDDAVARFGADPEAWRWGDLHKGYFEHALSGVLPDVDVGPLDMGGSSTTVMMAHYEASDFRVRNGASVRMVVDVGAWDNSVWINAPGQSGIPDSPHYADLAPLWARGDYVPMLYSVEAVDKATEIKIALHPA